MENVKPKEWPTHRTTVERLMLWGNFCLIAAFVAMTVRGMVQAASRDEVLAASDSMVFAVALGLLVPPLEAIRLTVIRMRKWRELSGRVKLLATELENVRRLAEKKEG